MNIGSWDDIRIALAVARSGTVSGAAEALGVHHATVIRHIDALEAQLGAKLFQRHARGYTPTEAGEDLLRVAQATEDQFNQLQGRIKGRGEGVSGEIDAQISACASLEGVAGAATAEAAAGLVAPQAMATVFRVFPPDRRGRAMGIYGIGVILAPALGPTVGGVMVDHWSWHYVFLLPVPACAARRSLRTSSSSDWKST